MIFKIPRPNLLHTSNLLNTQPNGHKTRSLAVQIKLCSACEERIKPTQIHYPCMIGSMGNQRR